MYCNFWFIQRKLVIAYFSKYIIKGFIRLVLVHNYYCYVFAMGFKKLWPVNSPQRSSSVQKKYVCVFFFWLILDKGNMGVYYDRNWVWRKLFIHTNDRNYNLTITCIQRIMKILFKMSQIRNDNQPINGPWCLVK